MYNKKIFSGALTKSQFPVFTIYAQKSCLGVRPCERAWCFDRVRGYHLKGRGKRTHTVGSRQMCLDLCLGENEFVCRSVVFMIYLHSVTVQYPTILLIYGMN